MMYCPYTQKDILATFGIASLVDDKDVLIKEDDKQHIVHFNNQNEALKFINDFYFSSLFYSMETEDDFKIKTDENAEEMKKLLNRRKIDKESIMLSRKIKIEENIVHFIIGDETFELLDSNVALQSILKKVLVDGVINLSQRLWGKIDTAKITFYLFADKKPNVNSEQLRLINFYTSPKCTRINRFLQSSLEYRYLEHDYPDMNFKEVIDSVFVFMDTMQPIDSDIIVYRGSSSDDNRIYRFNSELGKVDFTNNTSTSTTKSSSTRFVKEMEYEIIVKKGTPILWVGLLEGENSYENEILLPPAKFKILKSKNGWVEYYRLEMMELLDYGQLMINQLKKLKEEAQEENLYETFSKKNKDNKHIEKVAEIEKLILYVQDEIYKRNCNAILEANTPIITTDLVCGKSY